MNKGDILTVVESQEDEGGTLVRTDSGELIGILSARGVKVGTKMQVGPVCGEWCRLFLLGQSFQGRILEEAAAKTSLSQD